jgi:hypothetical protein
MNAIELKNPEGVAMAWACSAASCKKIYCSQVSADRCCLCSICQQPTDASDYTMLHKTCSDKAQSKRIEKQIAAATIVDDWDGGVFATNDIGPDDGGWFHSLDALEEYCDDDPDVERPEWAFLCQPETLRKVTVDDIVEMSCADMHEEVSDSITGDTELRAALNAFYEANKPLMSYTPDYKRVVRVQKRED